jgi:hypothetical protein
MFYAHLLIVLVTFTAVYFLLIIVYIANTTQKISRLVRKTINPSFPVTGKEFYEAIEKSKSPIAKVKIAVATLKNCFKILAVKQSGNKELDRFLVINRIVLFVWIGFMLVDAALILAAGREFERQ